MHDSIVNQTAVVGDTSVTPEPPARARGAEKASGFYVVRALDEEPAALPSNRRRASRSWLPGAWGDPF